MKGDGSVYKRGKVWWVKYYVNGLVVCESARTAIKEDAKTFLRNALKKTREPNWLAPDKQRVTVDELVADVLQNYLLVGKSKRHKKASCCWRVHLVNFFGGKRADQAGTQQFREYQTKRVAAGAANATINRELQVLHAAFKAAVENDPPKMQRLPKFPWLPEDNARRVFIDQELANKLKQAASKRSLATRVFLEMAFTYGWRRGELAGLCARHISLGDRTIRLDKTKNRDGREVPITPTLFPWLEALVTGRALNDNLLGFTYDQYDTEWKHLCADVGIKPGRKAGCYTPHDMRRSSARNKRRAGVPTSVIMELQGWRTEAMFRRYNIVDMADKISALELEQRGGNA